MCTVVWRWQPDEPLQLLALRDEFVGREFDDPDKWWPDHPGVVGGRDRRAGGSWCVSDVATGVTALVVNRIERLEGTPSRGRLPLAAVGADWTEQVDHTTMASFTLLRVAPDGVAVWTWDADTLHRLEPGPGVHLLTSDGVDADDPKTVRFAPQFDRQPWTDVVTGAEPSPDESALVVRREHDDRTYATVFGQLITARPGSLGLDYSRTPWAREGWTDRLWTA